MGIKSKGRGTAAAFGLLLVFAGLIGGALLFFLSIRRHDDAVKGFARAPVGCISTFDFTETGVFYVFEELDSIAEPPVGDCTPTADPLEVFNVELTGPAGVVELRRDDSIRYDVDGYFGRSVRRFEIAETGEYEVDVRGDDELTVAAIGRDPDEGVAERQQWAIISAIGGVVLGLLLLVLAGRRSKRAADYATPIGPGWGPRPTSLPGAAWPPEAPRLDQVPVNPHEPAEPAAAAPPLPERARSASPSPWAPPTSDDVADGDAPPAPPRPTPPTLPDTPGKPSGV